MHIRSALFNPASRHGHNATCIHVQPYKLVFGSSEVLCQSSCVNAECCCLNVCSSQTYLLSANVEVSPSLNLQECKILCFSVRGRTTQSHHEFSNWVDVEFGRLLRDQWALRFGGVLKEAYTTSVLVRAFVVMNVFLGFPFAGYVATHVK